MKSLLVALALSGIAVANSLEKGSGLQVPDLTTVTAFNLETTDSLSFSRRHLATDAEKGRRERGKDRDSERSERGMDRRGRDMERSSGDGGMYGDVGPAGPPMPGPMPGLIPMQGPAGPPMPGPIPDLGPMQGPAGSPMPGPIPDLGPMQGPAGSPMPGPIPDLGPMQGPAGSPMPGLIPMQGPAGPPMPGPAQGPAGSPIPAPSPTVAAEDSTSLQVGPQNNDAHGPFSVADANGDGYITLPEVTAFTNENHYRSVGIVEFFNETDTNGDEMLTPDELTDIDPPEAFDGTDLDGDGIVSLAEVEEWGNMEGRTYRNGIMPFFHEVDTDDDNVVDPDELAAAHASGLLGWY